MEMIIFQLIIIIGIIGVLIMLKADPCEIRYKMSAWVGWLVILAINLMDFYSRIFK